MLSQGIGRQRVFGLRREYRVGYVHPDRVKELARGTEEQARTFFERARAYDEERYARRQSSGQTRRGTW